MLLYKNGCFHYGKVSYMLPEGCMLLTAELECMPLYGLQFSDAEQRYTVTVMTDHNEQGAKAKLYQVAADSGFRFDEVTPYTQNGLKAWYAKYNDGHYHYIEFAVDAESGAEDEDGEDQNILTIYATAESAEDIQKAYHDTLIWDFLASIRIEP